MVKPPLSVMQGMRRFDKGLISSNTVVNRDKPDSKKTDLSRKQFLTAKETLGFLHDLGIQKATYPLSKMLILSVQAGMFKSVAVLVGLVLSLGCPGITHDNPGMKKLLFAAAFPVGLILVTLYSAELFTSSVLVLPPSYLVGKIKFKHMMKSLVVVFMGNFVGSLTFAYFLGHLTGVLEDEPWRSGLISFVEKKAHAGFGRLFLKGVGCNFMICLGTYAAMSALDVSGKVLALYLPSFTFAAIGFEHSIANMFVVPLGMMEGADVTYRQFLLDAVFGSALGNAVGGGIFVGLAAFAVHADFNILTYQIQAFLHRKMPKEVVQAIEEEVAEDIEAGHITSTDLTGFGLAGTSSKNTENQKQGSPSGDITDLGDSDFTAVELRTVHKEGDH